MIYTHIYTHTFKHTSVRSRAISTSTRASPHSVVAHSSNRLASCVCMPRLRYVFLPIGVVVKAVRVRVT